MMRERKDRYVDWPLIYRFGLQSRQDPHAAPASGGLFEQNLALTNYKCVLFDEPLCVQSGFPDRDYFRIFREAESFYGANAAFRLSGKTDKRAKIDECRVVNAGVGFWNERGRILPKRFPARAGIDRFAKIEKAGQNADGVGFDDRD